jgi:hypothetical protein
MGRLKNMIAQRGNEMVQEKGCQQIVQYSEAASTSDKVTIVKSGGLRVLLDAMKTFPDNFFLQMGACGAIQNLTAKSKQDSGDSIRDSIGDSIAIL